VALGDRIKLGDYVLLYLDLERRWLAQVGEGSFHTHVGVVALEALEGLEYGSPIYTSLGRRLWVLKPTVEDFVMKSERRTQIVYPKDGGLILVKAGLGPGDRVLEIGTGSGALTTIMANVVRPDGHIYTYEVRREFLEMARRNIARLGLEPYVTFHLSDAKAGVEERDVDLCVVDIGDPWEVVGVVRKALKGGGVFVGVTPTVNQLERLVEALRSAGFVAIESVELLARKLEARAGRTRPATRMIGHTAYLTFARSTLEEE
jgi:tRNA (adenine57-N1/adenine58-N1)-methyltransferase